MRRTIVVAGCEAVLQDLCLSHRCPAGVAGGISVAHSASCGYPRQANQARVAGDIKAALSGPSNNETLPCTPAFMSPDFAGSRYAFLEPTAGAVGYRYIAGYAATGGATRLQAVASYVAR
jgi:hypothetical protein